MAELHAVILAAGQGTRMKSRLPKVLHQVAGKAMVDHVIAAVREAGATRITVVVGHERQQLIEHLSSQGVETVNQEPQLGTGHAVLQALPRLGDAADVVVVYGDSPLLQGRAVTALVE